MVRRDDAPSPVHEYFDTKYGEGQRIVLEALPKLDNSTPC